MIAKNTRTIQRTRIRHATYLQTEEVADPPRAQLIGKARPVSSGEIAPAQASETDVLLHQIHEQVAQLREAAGRPRLDI